MLLTYEEAVANLRDLSSSAKLLGIKKERLRSAIRRNDVPCFRIGCTTVFTPFQLNQAREYFSLKA